jgi:hypothetical protein
MHGFEFHSTPLYCFPFHVRNSAKNIITPPLHQQVLPYISFNPFPLAHSLILKCTAHTVHTISPAIYNQLSLYTHVTTCTIFLKLLNVGLHFHTYGVSHLKKKSYTCNKPWRPRRLWYVEEPTFSWQSVHRWLWGCNPYVPAALYFLMLISVTGWEKSRVIVPHCVAYAVGKLKRSNDRIRNRTRGLPACSVVPQPTTLRRTPLLTQRNCTS